MIPCNKRCSKLTSRCGMHRSPLSCSPACPPDELKASIVMERLATDALVTQVTQRRDCQRRRSCLSWWTPRRPGPSLPETSVAVDLGAEIVRATARVCTDVGVLTYVFTALRRSRGC